MRQHIVLVLVSVLGACCGGGGTNAADATGGEAGSSSASSTSSTSSSSSSSGGTGGGAPNCIQVIVPVAVQTATDTPTNYHLVKVQSPATLDVTIEANAMLASNDTDYWGLALERNNAVWQTSATTQTKASGGVGDLGSTSVTLYAGLPVVAGDDVALLIGPVLHPADLPASVVTARVCTD